MVIKNLQKKTVSYLCLLCALVCPFVLCFAGTQNLLSSRLSVVLICGFLTICWVLNFRKVTSKAELIVASINLLFLILSAVKNGSYGVIITYYNIMIALMVFNNISFSDKQVTIIRALTTFLLAALLLSFTYTKQYDVMWIYSGDNLINSNTFGLFLLILYLNTVCLADSFTLARKQKNALFVVLTIIALFFVWQSGCRSAMISILFFCVLIFYRRYEYKKILLFLVILGLAFPVIYISAHEVFGPVQFLGKNLFSGRQTVWINTWNAIKGAPILGSGTAELIQIGNGQATDSAHNVYLAFWKTIGLVPMLSFAWLLFRGEKTNSKFTGNSISRKAFLACMIVCAVETLLNDGNYNYLILLYLMGTEPNMRSGGNNDDT